MQLSSRQLASLGHDLYGTNWKTALATLINVSDRTMRRYAQTGVKLNGAQAEKVIEYVSWRADILAAKYAWLVERNRDD